MKLLLIASGFINKNELKMSNEIQLLKPDIVAPMMLNGIRKKNQIFFWIYFIYDTFL